MLYSLLFSFVQYCCDENDDDHDDDDELWSSSSSSSNSSRSNSTITQYYICLFCYTVYDFNYELIPHRIFLNDFVDPIIYYIIYFYLSSL